MMNIDPKVLSVTLSEVLTDIVRKNHTVEEIAMSHDVFCSMMTLKQGTCNPNIDHYMKDGDLTYRFCGFYVHIYTEWPENVIRVFDQSYRLLALIEINDDGTTTTHVITDTE